MIFKLVTYINQIAALEMRNENRNNQIVCMFDDLESDWLQISGASAWALFILWISNFKETSKNVGTYCSKVFSDIAH